MSSSMMRGMQLNNSSIAINMRDNLIMDVIKIEDSDNDSDEDTLHIVEDSIDESIAIDDSESDEQAIDLSMSSSKYMSNEGAVNGNESKSINFSKFYSSSTSVHDHTYNKNVQSSTYQSNPLTSLSNGIANIGYSNMNVANGLNVPHQQNNGVMWRVQHADLLNLPSIKIRICEAPPRISEVAPVRPPRICEVPQRISEVSNEICEQPPAVNESFVYQCEFCSESFSADQLLIDHCARMHTKDIKCQHCEKTFYWEKDLHFHMRKHIKKGRGFKCQICTGLFLKAVDLKEHMKMHDKDGTNSGDSSFVCDICDKIFKTSRLLQEHKRRCYHKQCEVCLEYFSSDVTLLQHFSVHVQPSTPTTPSAHSCDECNEVFLKKSELKEHRELHRLYVCELCSSEFRRKDDIKSHLQLDCTQRTLFHCPVCNKSFLSEKDLETHTNTLHYDRNKCEFCFQRFLYKPELEDHLAHHNIEHPYQCHICLSPMASKRIFNLHLKSYNDKTNFKCEKCSRWFQSDVILQNHLLTHSKDTFNCTICRMTFSNPQRFELHSTRHNKNQFQCDICKQSFRTRKLIILHMVDSHRPRKRCHICDKEFLNQRRLRTHLKSHYVRVEFPDEA